MASLRLHASSQRRLRDLPFIQLGFAGPISICGSSSGDGPTRSCRVPTPPRPLPQKRLIQSEGDRRRVTRRTVFVEKRERHGVVRHPMAHRCRHRFLRGRLGLVREGSCLVGSSSPVCVSVCLSVHSSAVSPVLSTACLPLSSDFLSHASFLHRSLARLDGGLTIGDVA